jgi:crotonobetainyl-CoA:carnitine CoA-transferase CaiB-like acyl-CoA transferase
VWAEELVAACPDLGTVEALTAHLCELAGPDGLAAESQYAERVHRRRERRRRRLRNKEAWAKRAADQLAAMPRPEGRAAVKAARSGDLDAVKEMLSRLEAR